MADWQVKVLEVKESVLADNDVDANVLRQENRERGICYYNLMSSPGAGKTTFLKGTIMRLKDTVRFGVMEADIDSDVDAKRIALTGAKAIQLHTGGMCHLDAGMTRQGLEGLDTSDVELAILENVGNLVCPAEFDTGATKNAMILSVPEGEDKPLKYPLMFSICDVVLINKIDVMPYFDEYVSSVNCGYRKPSPVGLERIAERFGADKSEMIFVGDEEKDIKTADRFGCKSVLIDRKHSGNNFGQTHTITKLTELFPILI